MRINSFHEIYRFDTLTAVDALPDAGYESFKTEFERLSGIKLNLYKEKQMKRRINTLIQRKQLSGYEAFLHRLETDPAELQSFIEYITINVTEFFRTPDQWKVMEAEVLPALFQNTRHKVRIWSCACSTGEEAYSLAMSCLNYAAPDRFQIIATDLDEKVLSKAESGTYSAKALEHLPEDVINRHFNITDSGFCVSEELRSCVAFRRLDLLQDPYPMDCDMIVCRNILIYFTEKAKEDIYNKFKESLKPDGFLFTGNTEQLIYYKKYGLQKVKNFLYKNL